MKQLSVFNVSKDFTVGTRTIRALDHVNFDVEKGECLAVVGESGSGKSTIANIILGIHDASDGGIIFNGHELPDKRDRTLRRTIQLVQQNPLSALNPRRSIGASLRLPLDIHDIGPKAGRRARVAQLLEEVGLRLILQRARPPAFRAASASAWRLPVRLPASRSFWCWMSRRRRLTFWFRRGC
nr:ATP-binding cassette domain-containing protein [uncultured Martelella sp.]